MKKMKKVVALLLASTLALSMLTACGTKKDPVSETPASETTETPAGETAETPEAAEPSNNPVTLKTVSMFGGTDPNRETYKAVSDQFMADNPHVKIEDQSQTSDQEWKTRVAADFAVGNEPDVIQFFTDANATDVLAANKFVTIEEIRAVYPDYAKDTLETALDGAKNPDGVQRAVPTTGFWEGLFCNKDLFDQYNVPLPTDWDSFLNAITVFKENNVTPIAVSLSNVPHYWIEFLMLGAAGPDSFTQVPVPTEAPEDWVKGLEMFKTLRDMGAFPVDTDTVDNAFAEELFKGKKAAMQLDGNWYLNGIEDQENTVVIALPILTGGKAEQGAMIGGISSGFYITKKAWEDPDKRDAAVKFVMAHTNKDSVTKYWNGAGVAAAAVDPIEGMTPLAISGLEYSQAATSISAPTDSRMTTEAYSTLVGGIVDVSIGNKSAEDLLNEVLAINAK